MTGMIRVSGFVAAAIFAAGVGSARAQAAPAPVDKGAAVYAAQKCSMCHSLDGKGQAKGPLDLPKADLDALITFMVAKKKVAERQNVDGQGLARAFRKVVAKWVS